MYSIYTDVYRFFFFRTGLITQRISYLAGQGHHGKSRLNKYFSNITTVGCARGPRMPYFARAAILSVSLFLLS